MMVITTTVIHSQERAMVWYFGNHAGLDFSDGDPIELIDGSMYAEAGCTSICDTSGNLLFYTNGKIVWNRNHQKMPSGDSLNGSQVLNQNSIITPLPGSDSLYYLFTISDLDSIKGFNYSIVDMSLDGGLGDLIVKNTTMKINVLEKITAIEHCNGLDYWIIVHGYDNDFYSFLFTEEGIMNEPVQTNIGTVPKADIGYMKTSPRSDKIILPINDDELLAEIFPFNYKTGVVSAPLKVISKTNQTYCYGLAFSSNGNLLYVSTRGMNYAVWQYNLQENSEILFNNNAIQISEGNNFAMQLAPNGKIYIASENRPYINVINNPNSVGTVCNYEAEAVTFINATSLMGMPNFVQTWNYKSEFEVENTCYNDTTHFSFNEIQNTDSCRWRIYDSLGSQIVSFNKYINYHVFGYTGKYYTELVSYHCGVIDVIEDTIEIYPYPVTDMITDTSICNNCYLVLDAGDGFDTYLWNDSTDHQLLEIYNPGLYWVEVSKNDCKSIDSTLVYEIIPDLYLPNAFTPNGDGLNDEFRVVNPDYVMDFKMSIFCRRGTNVFTTDNIYLGWNGAYRDEPCFRDTYVWVIQYSYFDDRGTLIDESKTGWVSLIR